MKKKKQKIMIAFLAILTVALGSWLMVKPNGLRADEKKEVEDVTSTTNSSIPLPIADDEWESLDGYTEKWLDVDNSYLPRDFTFFFNYLPGKTRLIIPKDTENKITNLNSYLDDGYITFDTGKVNEANPANVFFENIGFKDGQLISIEVEISYLLQATDQFEYARLMTTDNVFLQIYYPRSSQGVKVTYKLCTINSKEKEPEVKYLPPQNLSYNFQGVGLKEYLSFSNSAIKNIYSPSGFRAILPSVLEFNQSNLSKGILEITSPVVFQQGVDYQFQSRGTLTFPNVNEISFTNKITTEAMGLSGKVGLQYSNTPATKVEFPDPQSSVTTFQEIIDTGEDENPIRGVSNGFISPLNYGFIQQVPYELATPINNRTQIPTWIVNEPNQQVNVLNESSDWKVISEDNPELGDGNLMDWFNYDPVNKTIKPKGENSWNGIEFTSGTLIDNDFYNHYYLFNRQLTLNPNSVISKISIQNDGYFFKYSGSVNLDMEDKHKVSPGQDGMNQGRKPADYITNINFYAPLQYVYIDSGTGKKIPTGNLPEAAKAKGDGIVTWDAPLTPRSLADDTYTEDTGMGGAPVIPGYSFKEAKLNDGDDFQVKVTKLLKNGGDAKKAEDYDKNNVVTLYYTQDTYQAAITIKDGPGSDAQTLSTPASVPSSASYFQVAVVANREGSTWTKVADPTWEPLTNYKFTVYDKKYQIRQVSGFGGYDWAGSLENLNKKPEPDPGPVSPEFFVSAAEGQFMVHGMSDARYQFPTYLTKDETDPTKLKLNLTVINQPIGNLSLSVDTIYFGNDNLGEDSDGNTLMGATLPLPANRDWIKRSPQSTNWTIKLKDTLLDNYKDNPTEGWQLDAELRKDFTWENSTISDILVFVPKDKSINDNDVKPLKKGDIVPLGKDKEKSWTWDATHGFLLKLSSDKQKEIIAKGTEGKTYVAELLFTLGNTP